MQAAALEEGAGAYRHSPREYADVQMLDMLGWVPGLIFPMDKPWTGCAKSACSHVTPTEQH